MRSEWITLPLGDVITLQRGFDLPSYMRSEGDIPIVTSSGITGTHSEAKAKAPGVVMGRYGTIGQIYYITRDYWPHNTALYVRDFKSNDPHFIYYLLQTLDFNAHNDKSSVPGLNRNHLHLIPVTIPAEIEEQRAIASVLGSLDDKIEANRRENETMEATARALFKSWFVDFDPVRAKMEGRQPAGMDAEIAALFPDSFEESALGLIPAGWRVAKLGEVAEFAYGKALKEDTRRIGTVPVYGSNGQVGWHDEALVKAPGIVIGRKGNPGVVTWVQNDFFPIDTTFFLVKTGLIDSLPYLYYYTEMMNLASLGADSAVPGLNRNMAYMSDIVVPNVSVLTAFDGFVIPIFEQMNMSESESHTLAETRNVLLPKLLSGDIKA
jgi:type I restriction enzyme, S subunit